MEYQQEGLVARFVFVLLFEFVFVFERHCNHLEQSDRRACSQDVQGLPQVESCQRDARHPGKLIEALIFSILLALIIFPRLT